ncbi:hypothetical protein CRG98_033233 [Punica granatum]|uniref:Retrotransposon gag domain-containing protein n=1 Tax=Punica granatum TaxID=22663 RepID=A0A2I0IQW5_PUNGR|nr:hypothetical protein CRG98_033233 [Punica granatum]
MDEENVHEVPRGLTLDQEQFLGFLQRQDKLSAQLDQLTQVVERIALVRAPPQCAHRVPKRNVRVEDEADQEDELPEEKEQPVPRQQQRCGMSVEDYVKEFKQLTMGCELREAQETSIACFLGGLNKEIADMIKRQPFVSLEDVIKLAIKVLRQRKHCQRTTPRVFNQKPVIAGSTPQRHFTSEFSNWREVTIQNPHAVESEVEEAVVDVCVVTSKEKVEYADEGEELKA